MFAKETALHCKKRAMFNPENRAPHCKKKELQCKITETNSAAFQKSVLHHKQKRL